MFWVLIGLHFLCDYPLQGDFLAVGKGSFAKPHFGVPWYHCMAAHCAIHGLAVGLVTGIWWFGLIEFALHFMIDVAKCVKATNIQTDQAMHIVCKLIYVLALLVMSLGARS